MSENDTLKCIVFFSIFGITLGLLKKEKSSSIINLFDIAYSALLKFMDSLIFILPLGSAAVLATLFSQDKVINTFGSLFKLLLLYFLICLILIIISFTVIKIKTKCTFKNHWKAIKRTFFLTIGANSSSVAIPLIMEDVPKYININPEVIKSTIPLGINLCSLSDIIRVSSLAIYACYIYNITINIEAILVIVSCSILFSISKIGQTYSAAASILTVILDPLGIPLTAIAVVYSVTFRLSDPIYSFCKAYTNIAISSILSK
jgi:proton glutamate symport protein